MVWRAWSRCYLVGSVLKKCTRDRRVRELLETFRQTFLKPRRTFMLAAATAVNKEDEPNLTHDDANISDEDLEVILTLSVAIFLQLSIGHGGKLGKVITLSQMLALAHCASSCIKGRIVIE